MKLQRIMSLTRQAIDKYHMIQEGDRVCIGISGGKDSLTLLYALSEIRKFYPINFELEAVTVDLGFSDFHTEQLEELCGKLKVNYTLVSTEIGKIVFDLKEEKSPCSLCAKMRKGALNQAAIELNCNKIAYAHHKDDIIETMLMSLIYEGRFYSFSPVTYLDRTQLTVIRPLMYMSEMDVIGFRNLYDLPVAKNPCPVDGHTKREYVKKLIKELNHENPGVKKRMFTAIENGNIPGWTTTF